MCLFYCKLQLFFQWIHTTKNFLSEFVDDEATLLFGSHKALKNGSSIIVQTSILPPNEIFEKIAFSINDLPVDDVQNINNNSEYNEEVLSYVDYMIPELPEEVTEYFELKKNVRRIKLYDYKSYSNSRYIQMNKKDISLKKKKLSNSKEIETIKTLR